MIRHDSSGFLATKTFDGGDTAVREGLMAIFTGKPGKLLDLVDASGICVRHPNQKPWSNPKNFTKDQLKCLVAGLHAIGRADIVRLIYQAHIERNYFCQNSERDFPGSKKGWFQWVQDFSKNDEAGDDVTPKGKPTFKIFDHADLLFPNDVLTFDKASGFENEKISNQWFKTWAHMIALKTHANSNHNEENQMFSECFVLGTLEAYVRLNPRWRARDLAFWSDPDRDEIEFHEMKVEFLKQRGLCE